VVDSVLYWVLTGLLFLCILWLLFTPAPGHDPLIVFTHAGLVR
jgi:hypothetical protein